MFKYNCLLAYHSITYIVFMYLV